MNEAVREMTFEEEAELYEKEARELFAKEKPGYETPPINSTVRCGMRIISKARDEIEWLEKRMRWISVEERLPEVGQMVLVYCRSRMYKKHITVSTYKADYSYTRRCYWSRRIRNVTHWMPLPVPPEVKL